MKRMIIATVSDMAAKDKARLAKITNSPNQIEELSNENSIAVNRKLVQNKLVGPKILAKVYNKYPDDWYIVQDVASNPNTPPDVLYDIVRNSGQFRDNASVLRRRVCENPNASEDAFNLILSEDGGRDTYKYLIARNPNTSPDMLDRLSHDDNDKVRYSVADNLNTSVDTLRNLSDDDNDIVLNCVASNPNTPPDILSKLAHCATSSYVRECVAKNKNTPYQTIEELKQDEDSAVRYHAARNHNYLLESERM